MIITDMSKDHVRQMLMERMVEEDDHWIWIGHIGKNGYPIMAIRLYKGKWKQYYAHRLMYWLDNNLPNELHVCHTCDIPLCINPTHLFLGTDQDNHTDKCNKGRQTKGENHIGHKLTDEIVIGLRDGSIKPSLRLARELGLSDSSHLYVVKNGKHWKHL